MKRWITMFAVVGLLAGCASTPKSRKPARRSKTQAVRDRRRDAAAAEAADRIRRRRRSRRRHVGVDPLKDPANILSRRSIYFDYDQFVVKEEFKPVVSRARGLSLRRTATGA